MQADARIGSPEERIDHAVHWKDKHDKLDNLLRKHGPGIIGEADFRRLKLIGEFYHHVGDMPVAKSVAMPMGTHQGLIVNADLSFMDS